MNVLLRYFSEISLQLFFQNANEWVLQRFKNIFPTTPIDAFR